METKTEIEERRRLEDRGRAGCLGGIRSRRGRGTARKCSGKSLRQHLVKGFLGRDTEGARGLVWGPVEA